MVTVNIEKKHLYVFALVLGIVFGILIVYAQLSTYNPNRPWHPLQQVSLDASGTNSVDESPLNGFVDNADRLEGRSGAAYQLNAFGSCGGGNYMTQLGDDGSTICRSAFITGSYIGNGGSGRRTIAVTGVSATASPRAFTLISSNAIEYIKNDAMTGDTCYVDDGSPAMQDCARFENTGFSFDRSSGPNSAGVTYYYMFLQ